jgi:hypothetical protein
MEEHGAVIDNRNCLRDDFGYIDSVQKISKFVGLFSVFLQYKTSLSLAFLAKKQSKSIWYRLFLFAVQ